MPEAPIQITIEFDAESKQILNSLSKSIGGLRNFNQFWIERGGIVDLIKQDIETNILQGVDPNLRTWPMLSPAYQRVVQRPRMILGDNALSAYARMASVRTGNTTLIFQPNIAFVKPHYEMLRRGWVSQAGGSAPPREWFGIHPWTMEKINKNLAMFVESKIARAVGRAAGYIR